MGISIAILKIRSENVTIVYITDEYYIDTAIKLYFCNMIL